MNRRFEGQTALVTGASRGLGRAIAQRLAAEGAYTLVGYHTGEEAAGETLAAVIAADGAGALLRLDVRDAEAVRGAIDGVLRGRGRIDILVNNAGIVRDGLAALLSAEDWRAVLEVHLDGTFHCCRAVLRAMLAARRGTIVNVSSVAGLRASPGQASYSAAKGGILALTRTLAAELAPRGVRVNAVVPGLLSTGMATRLDHRERERRLEWIPARRLGTGEEVAAAVAFLASDEASYVVGQAIVVDGGLSL
jgi:3-oxoacyl-[acyl-carrier protein] reductase